MVEQGRRDAPSVSGADWPATRAALDVAFHPRSLAVAGVSVNPAPMGNGAPGSGWGGRMFFNAVRSTGKLSVFATNPKHGLLEDGTRVYPSLAAVPEQIDYVISSVPAEAILALVDECVAKGVKILHLFTAGFRESGEEERQALESELLRRLRAGGIRMVGPNCMGVYSPAGGVSWMETAPVEPGPVGIVAQSGMNGSELIGRGAQRGLRFSYGVSFGNGTDLNECDYLQYLGEDPGTTVVLAYLEGVRDGRRFVRVAREVARQKPLAVLKGGLTAAGGRAASSHTGSLGGSAAVWRAVARQCGFALMESVDELIDFGIAAQHLSGIQGPRAGIVGGGGGVAVLAADACDRVGILVPPLAEETQRRLHEFTPVAGTSIRNPVDSMVMFGMHDFADTVQIVADDPNLDFLLLHFGVDMRFGRGGARGPDVPLDERLLEGLARVRPRLTKPVALVMHPPQSVGGMEAALRLQERSAQAGLALFPSVERAALAVRRYLDWRTFREAEGQARPAK